DERGLPEASRGDHPGGLDAEAALSCGGGRRQRRDLAMCYRRPLRRARRDGGLLRHDEQLHFRRRQGPVLRNGRRGIRSRRRIRRRRRGPDSHDQFAPDRPGGARMALSGAPGALRDPPREPRRAALREGDEPHPSMNRRSILTKTGKGLMEATGKTSALSRDLRNILKEIDGKVSVSELLRTFSKMTEPELLESLKSMEREGY